MQDLLAALALVLVLEGLLPFASPNSWRAAAARLAEVDARTVRIAGAVSIGIGLLVLNIVRG